jgi:NAD(P)-dependent dehydrogenase (short-subunit alcohol dehydrogenase family)
MKNIIISGGKGYLGKVVEHVLSENNFNVIDDRVDLTSEKAVKEYSREIKNKFGSIYAVIHTASAPLERKKVLEQSNQDFKLQFEVGVFGAFNLFKYFCPLITNGGAVIGILSKSIVDNARYSSSGSYIPTKYALRGLLRVLSDELYEQGIRVYGVSPAFMPGGLNRDIPQTVSQFITKKSLPENVTTPKAVAEVILNLVKDEKRNMNGKSIVVPRGDIIDL